MRYSSIVFSLVVLSTLAAGQQVGDSNRNYTIYNQGSLAASPAPVTIPNCLGCKTWANTYTTLDPLAPVVWVLANEGQIGWVATGSNSVDIGPSGIEVLFDGTTVAGPINPFVTDPSGSFQIGLYTPAGLAGTSTWLAMLHFAVSSPDGFWISQTHQVSFDPVNTLGPSQYGNPPGINLSLSDDDSVMVPLGLTFQFYGLAYTQCFVGSNGFITFGIPDTDFTESPAELASGPPRVAPWWDDLSPQSGGQVSYATTGFGLNAEFTVWWYKTPEFFVGGSNTFSLTLTKAPAVLGIPADYDVIFDYDSMTAADGIVGISPGTGLFGIPAGLSPIDFSQAPTTLSGAGNAFYEHFDPSGNPVDVYGHRILIDLDSLGYPTVQL